MICGFSGRVPVTMLGLLRCLKMKYGKKSVHTKKCHQRGSFVKLSESDMCTTVLCSVPKRKNKLQKNKNDFSRAAMI